MAKKIINGIIDSIATVVGVLLVCRLYAPVMYHFGEVLRQAQLPKYITMPIGIAFMMGMMWTLVLYQFVVEGVRNCLIGKS